MNRAIVVTDTEKSRDTLSGLLAACEQVHPICVTDGAEAEVRFATEEFDLIVICLRDRAEAINLAVRAARGSNAGVLLLVAQALPHPERLAAEGVLVLEMPIAKKLFLQAVWLVRASRTRMMDLRSENVKLRRKIDDIRLIDRAKCVLIQYLGMTEAQAHRYIEKQAMDLQASRSEVAERLLKTYES